MSKKQRTLNSVLGLSIAAGVVLAGLGGGGLASAESGAAAGAREEVVGLPRFPSISPDGSTIVFSWGGDLWRVAASGGEATRLTAHALDDLHSAWSPDGRALVFSSMRDGYLNLYHMQRDGSGLRQLTYSDRFLRNPGYAHDRDGAPVITFSSYLEADVYREQRAYAIAPQGGEHWRLQPAFGSEPRLSADGRWLVFTRGGHYHGWQRRHYRGADARNLWLYDRKHERFVQLTDHPGDDGQARWLDDQTLLFLSDRDDGTVDLYRLTLDTLKAKNAVSEEGGAATAEAEDGVADVVKELIEIERLTHARKRDVRHFDVAPQADMVVLQVWDRLYTLDLDAPSATPEPLELHAGEPGQDQTQWRQIDRDVSEAALSPDGEVMAYIAYGRVYVRHLDEHSPTQAVTPAAHARHKDLAWAPDGSRLYFTSDADGSESLYAAQVVLTRAELTAAPEMVPGKFSAELPGVLPDPIAAADKTASDRNAPQRWHDAVQFAVLPVLAEASHDRQARPSPDGTQLAFRRGRGDLMLLDLASGESERLVSGWDQRIEWRWSPDGRYIAYAQSDLDFSVNIFVVPTDGSHPPVNVTRHPRNDRNPRWSADGRKLSFVSNRAGETYDVYRVYLDAALERYSPRERVRYYRDAQQRAGAGSERTTDSVTGEVIGTATGPSGEPASAAAVDETVAERRTEALTQRDLESAWRRIERVTRAAAHEYDLEMTPGGDRYLFNRTGEGLMLESWDGSERKRLGGIVDVQHLSSSGDRLVYVANGRAGVVNLADARHRRPDISDRIRIDLQAQAQQKLREAARVIEEGFYQPQRLEQIGWAERVDDHTALLEHARTANEFNDIANRLMGELAASHTGVTNPDPSAARRQPSGRLGIEHAPVTLGDGLYGYRVLGVVARGPAARGAVPLRPGDLITAIGQEPLRAEESMLQRLRGRVGDELLVTFRRPGDPIGHQRQTLITPVDYAELGRLKYDAFKARSRAVVEERADGRLGYVHIQAMNQASLERFQADLYAAAEGKEGLIIDVRNNGGGHTTDRILTSLLAPQHAYTVPAGGDPAQTGHYPQDRLDAPRFTAPTNVLINAKSHSNAEILAHAFRTLGRGRLIGEPTYGGVISTGQHRLIDGATVRRPFRGWYLPDGTDMEHYGAPPDLRVGQHPDDEVAGRDRQLERAVDDLLERLDEADETS
ncbi:S41 family peptidase [Halorhodospira abdelmalekii]|uniref:S41 family peptidase n=1 Tax=Halorhodospira abdelmalekii TaxID=421629 RepID=UPI001F5B77C4|nr:S41 family peptidase [Halorhodospira abdelmalekii]